MQLTDSANNLDQASYEHGPLVSKSLCQLANNNGTSELSEKWQAVHQRDRYAADSVLCLGFVVVTELAHKRRKGLNAAKRCSITRVDMSTMEPSNTGPVRNSLAKEDTSHGIHQAEEHQPGC